MQTITIVDTSICTDNLGDEIIMASVNEVVSTLFPQAYVFRIPSHESLSDRTCKFLRQSSVCFIGGTNLLSSHIHPYGLWRLDEQAAQAFGDTRTVCLGTGWNDYMDEADAPTRELLTKALSSEIVHSARDGYTLEHLDKIGRRSVNTSCPTTWSLSPEHCASIPSVKSPSVVFTLSAWRRDIEADARFILLLKKQYSRLYFFPQMQDDFLYLTELGFDDVPLAGTTVQSYDHFLENEDVDFVGTRLHGGIRAMQKGRRALILAIDNRASEIAKSTNLPVVERTDTDGIKRWIEEQAATRIVLPEHEISAWKAQFCTPDFPKLAKPPRPASPPRGRFERAVSKIGRRVAGSK